MTNKNERELSNEELKNAAGGFSASQKRPKDEPDGGLSEDELRRAAGGAQFYVRNQPDSVSGISGSQGEGYGEPGNGNLSGRTTLE